MKVGDVIVALDDTDEGFTEGQVCLVHSISLDDSSVGDGCYDVHILKAWTDTHAYFGEPGEGHKHVATRIEEPDNFKVIGVAGVVGALGVAAITKPVLEVISEGG